MPRRPERHSSRNLPLIDNIGVGQHGVADARRFDRMRHRYNLDRNDEMAFNFDARYRDTYVNRALGRVELMDYHRHPWEGMEDSYIPLMQRQPRFQREGRRPGRSRTPSGPGETYQFRTRTVYRPRNPAQAIVRRAARRTRR